jgi:hypothetical protein
MDESEKYACRAKKIMRRSPVFANYDVAGNAPLVTPEILPTRQRSARSASGEPGEAELIIGKQRKHPGLGSTRCQSANRTDSSYGESAVAGSLPATSLRVSL